MSEETASYMQDVPGFHSLAQEASTVKGNSTGLFKLALDTSLAVSFWFYDGQLLQNVALMCKSIPTKSSVTGDKSI